MNQATEFDVESVAGTIASDVYFLWRTSNKFKWTETPGIMLKKVRNDIQALSQDELEATIETLTTEYGATVERNANHETVALRIRNVYIPISV